MAAANLGEATAMLCEDLITDILVRLPVKSLLRFRPNRFSEGGVNGFGFGFVSNTNDYKVIVLNFLDRGFFMYDDDEPLDNLEIYDLSTNSWREFEIGGQIWIRGDKHGTLLNETLHWIVREELDGIDSILAFDMSTELFQYIEVPDDLIGINGTVKYLRVLNDSLALFAFAHDLPNEEEQFVDIWIMKEYAVTESWTKTFSIGPLSGIKHPLMLWKNKAILLKIESYKGKLLSCTLDTHEIEEIKVEGDKCSLRIMGFHESLVSVSVE